MQVPFKIVGVFSDRKTSLQGNTSAVVELSQPLPITDMQRIAADFNQPATTFIWLNESKEWQVRWFASDGEIMLCGHGAMAAFVYLNQSHVTLEYGGGIIKGIRKDPNTFAMELEPIRSTPGTGSAQIAKGLGVNIKQYLSNNNKHIVEVEDEQTVKEMKPDFQLLKSCEPFGYIVTAPGDDVDFVSRTIVPKVRQLEDPATGSSHAALTPFWSDKLGKTYLTAIQLSERGGRFACNYENEIVTLSGESYVFSSGMVEVSK